MYNKVRCIDINSPYCPCLLAETNHCIFCSQLKGEDACNCNWAGVCILYEKHWKATKDENKGEDAPIRMEVEADLIMKRRIAEKTYQLEFEVTQELAECLKKPGSFVFLRRVCDAHFYHFPVGVMDVVDNKIEVIVEAIGPKSTRIFSPGHKILIRGPYYNGIFGQPWIDKMICGKIILLAGGMGQPPALSIVKALMKNNNEVTAILAPGKIGEIFVDEEIRSLGVSVHNVSSMRREGLPILNKVFSSPQEIRPALIVSAGPDEQHYGIISAMQAAGVNIPMAVTNNATMCCGEGICGSCEKETIDHTFLRTCKAQTDFNYFLHYK